MKFNMDFLFNPALGAKRDETGYYNAPNTHLLSVYRSGPAYPGSNSKEVTPPHIRYCIATRTW